VKIDYLWKSIIQNQVSLKVDLVKSIIFENRFWIIDFQR